ncbi:hypothetical protein [Enterococcus sp. HY326]|uniref:hypothetical protein n=1 Tax=Enterococcus sp. HY326 TaxID=2971265 RepID=UPI00223EB394|nr:hypothetical protein [Enterococcus sp. HY326]
MSNFDLVKKLNSLLTTEIAEFCQIAVDQFKEHILNGGLDNDEQGKKCFNKYFWMYFMTIWSMKNKPWELEDLFQRTYDENRTFAVGLINKLEKKEGN